jgi:probable HAF family extracellular repeat protein
MTDNFSALTVLATRARHLQPAGFAGLGAGFLSLALISATAAASVIDPKTVRYGGEDCDVIKNVFSDTTTKDFAALPVGSKVTGVVAKCPGKNSSPYTISLLIVRRGKDGPTGVPFALNSALGRRTLLLLAYATDPFVVGTYESTGSSFEPYHAFRYDLDTAEFRDLGTFGGPAGTSSALGVNIDGSVVVGASTLTTAGASPWQAFRWTEALGMQNLGSIAPNSYSEARATNHDGSVVVGGTYVPAPRVGDYDDFHAFRWVLSNPATGAGTFTDLGPATYEAWAVNGDGSVIVGIGNRHAFRWTQAGGVVDLGVLPGHINSMATAVSADGKVVVGISSSNFITPTFPAAGPQFDKNGSRAFRWTQATGMRDLNALLAADGVDLTGVTLTGALGLSQDGKTISGTGLQAGADDTSGFSVSYLDATTGGLPAGPNHQGLWWNAQESGWGINFAHQGDIVFATWFTYDGTGKPWWLIAELHQTASGVYSGPVSTVEGPLFNSSPFGPAPVETQVGTMTATFADAKHASLAFTVNGISQSKQVVPQEFGQLPTCTWGAQPDLALATNYTDLWWNASESGWGINFAHQGDVVFATWFTYDGSGKPWWLIAQLDKSATGGYSGPVSTVSGPSFGSVPFDASKVAETQVGTATVTFANGNAATFAYTVNGQSANKAITRQVFVAPGTVCQ